MVTEPIPLAMDQPPHREVEACMAQSTLGAGSEGAKTYMCMAAISNAFLVRKTAINVKDHA